MSDLTRPNLFDHARGELAQDAVLAWMAAWADHRYPTDVRAEDHALYTLGCHLIDLLLKDYNIPEDERAFSTVRVETQWRHIDVLITLDADKPERTRYVIIEDKTKTNERSGQIPGYVEDLLGGTSADKSRVHPVMVHTGDAHDLHRKEGYKVVRRRDVIGVLAAYMGDNAIVCDYRAHLQRWEEAVQAFETTPVEQWRGLQWQGFFSVLTEGRPGEGGREAIEQLAEVRWWGHVPKGNFWGLSWGHTPLADGSVIYLQIEGDHTDGRGVEWPQTARLVVKLRAAEQHNQKVLQRDMHSRVLQAADAAGSDERSRAAS